MTALKIDNYLRACLKAWVHCENCIREELNHFIPSEDLMRKCRTCAHSCFIVVCRMLSLSPTLPEAALDCMIACRDLKKESERHIFSGEVLYCGEVCSHCGEVVKNLLVQAELN